MKDLLELIGLGVAVLLTIVGYILVIAAFCLAIASPIILIVWLIIQAFGG